MVVIFTGYCSEGFCSNLCVQQTCCESSWVYVHFCGLSRVRIGDYSMIFLNQLVLYTLNNRCIDDILGICA